REKNEISSGSGAGAGGRNVGDNWNLRREDRVDDHAHRAVQPPGRIDGNEDQVGMLATGLLDAMLEVFGEDGLDLAVNAELSDFRWRIHTRRSRCGRRGGGCECD